MITIIYFFWNSIIKCLFQRYNMDIKKSSNEQEDIEKNINARLRCKSCFKIINDDYQIYCLLDNLFCTNNCRLQYIKFNRIIV